MSSEKKSWMWERMTEPARRAIYRMQEEGERRGRKDLDTEHLLLALLQEDGTAAHKLLSRLGVSRRSIREEIERRIAGTDLPVESSGDFRLTSAARYAIELANDERRQINCTLIGTEHLLIGLLREPNGMAARVLMDMGLELERTRRTLSAPGEDETILLD